MVSPYYNTCRSWVSSVLGFLGRGGMRRKGGSLAPFPPPAAICSCDHQTDRPWWKIPDDASLSCAWFDSESPWGFKETTIIKKQAWLCGGIFACFITIPFIFLVKELFSICSAFVWLKIDWLAYSICWVFYITSFIIPSCISFCVK